MKPTGVKKQRQNKCETEGAKGNKKPNRKKGEKAIKTETQKK
jgi:hypothetical protein